MKQLRLFIIIIGLIFIGAGSSAAESTDLLEVTASESIVKFSYQAMSESQILVSALDAEDNPVLDLLPTDITLRMGSKTAKIVSIEPLRTNKDIPLNIVLVLDNSFSMVQRKAVQPMLEALEAFLGTIRPFDNVTAIVFDQKNTMTIRGHDLHVKSFTSGDPEALRTFFKENLADKYTDGTFLYDGMLAGVDAIAAMPPKSNKFLVVFSDGKDINSSVKTGDVTAAVKELTNYSAFTVDYTPAKSLDPFLDSFAVSSGGKSWKAASATELLPIFKSFSTTLLHRHIVTYRFLNPPEGALSFLPDSINIEEITTIDSSPLLNYVYFDTGQGEISPKYKLFARQGETDGFSSETLKSAIEKHYHVLNIIGHRMRTYPHTRIRLIGCNANVGEEKGRLDLSKTRAESVKSYLRYLWAISPDRIDIESRNLPEQPSSSRSEQGTMENQRVEIRSDNPEMLDTLKTTYVEKVCDATDIQISPQIKAEADITSWKIVVRGDDEPLKTFEGVGDIPAQFSLKTDEIGLDRIAGFKTITADIEAVDKEDNPLEMKETTMIPVNFVRREELMAKKDGYKVVEKYALILFDYDSAEIKSQNKTIMDRIIKRLNAVPNSSVKVTGHTDDIGSVDYNMGLSDRRANAVVKELLYADLPMKDDIRYSGIGPFAPLYDNKAPEGRALNRTVTVTLEYEDKSL
ncbi:MAG: OmpA family protein [Desulfobacteraceae bacterium]|nr:OmpA family protein [Desulfobacteraceae bacterium]